jgi:hypothetical protein
VGAQCNTMSSEGEEETSWRHKEHDNSIIAFRGGSGGILRALIAWRPRGGGEEWVGGAKKTEGEGGGGQVVESAMQAVFLSLCAICLQAYSTDSTHPRGLLSLGESRWLRSLLYYPEKPGAIVRADPAASSEMRHPPSPPLSHSRRNIGVAHRS